MQLHDLKLKTKFHKEKRVGRGGKRGTTSGRGTKGQKARAGHRIRPAERDILKRIPKLRGYKFKSFREKPEIVNFFELERKFKNGDTISPETLLKAGLIYKIKGRMPEVKILGKGGLDKNFIFKDVIFSNKARLKIGVPIQPVVGNKSITKKQKEEEGDRPSSIKNIPKIKKTPKSKGSSSRQNLRSRPRN